MLGICRTGGPWRWWRRARATRWSSSSGTCTRGPALGGWTRWKYSGARRRAAMGTSEWADNSPTANRSIPHQNLAEPQAERVGGALEVRERPEEGAVASDNF